MHSSENTGIGVWKNEWQREKVKYVRTKVIKEIGKLVVRNKHKRLLLVKSGVSFVNNGTHQFIKIRNPSFSD